MGLFETEFLATDDNIAALADLSGLWIDRVHDRRPPKEVVLYLDSSVSPTYGDQEGTASNGHFGCTCYHPLFLFISSDLERRALRPVNVHSAHEWQDLLEPIVARYRNQSGATFASMPRSRCRRSTIFSKPKASIAPSASRQQGSAGEHCPSASPPGRRAARSCSPHLRQLQLSGRIVGQETRRGRT
jgi:hypothetical protein